MEWVDSLAAPNSSFTLLQKPVLKTFMSHLTRSLSKDE